MFQVQDVLCALEKDVRLTGVGFKLSRFAGHNAKRAEGKCDFCESENRHA